MAAMYPYLQQDSDCDRCDADGVPVLMFFDEHSGESFGICAEHHSDECREILNELCITWEDNPEMCFEAHFTMMADSMCTVTDEYVKLIGAIAFVRMFS